MLKLALILLLPLSILSAQTTTKKAGAGAGAGAGAEIEIEIENEVMDEMMLPKEEGIILSVLEFQRVAWNEGDIEQFMEGYWNSEELSFTGKKGVTKGWQATKENYLKSYPDRATMGQLGFEVLELNFLCDESAHMIGKWHLTRQEQEDVGGFFTLIWMKIEGRWLIVADHTS